MSESTAATATTLLERVPDDGRVESVQAARDLGDCLADAVERRFGDAEPALLIESFGVRLVRDDWPGLADCQLLGTYSDGEITIYPQAIEDRASSLDVTASTLERAVLAHELGHHLLTPVTFGPAQSSGVVARIAPLLRGQAIGHRPLEERAVEQFSTALTGCRHPAPSGSATTAEQAAIHSHR